MQNKKFAERLNKELDEIGVPTGSLERIEVLSKLIKVPKFKAEALLNGATYPSQDILDTLAEEFEVNVNWLAGKETGH